MFAFKYLTVTVATIMVKNVGEKWNFDVRFESPQVKEFENMLLDVF